LAVSRHGRLATNYELDITPIRPIKPECDNK
jgi:hypothetical protein